MNYPDVRDKKGIVKGLLDPVTTFWNHPDKAGQVKARDALDS